MYYDPLLDLHKLSQEHIPKRGLSNFSHVHSWHHEGLPDAVSEPLSWFPCLPGVRASADFSLTPPLRSVCGVSFTLPFFDYQGNRTSPILLDNRSEALPAVRRKPNTQASVCAAASIWRKGSFRGPCLKILWLMWDYPQSQSWCLSLFPSYTSCSGLVFFFHKLFPIFNFQDFMAQIRCLRVIFYLLHFVMLPQFPQM